MKMKKKYSEKVKLGRFSPKSEKNFRNREENLKQGEMHQGGMDAPAFMTTFNIGQGGEHKSIISIEHFKNQFLTNSCSTYFS